MFPVLFHHRVFRYYKVAHSECWIVKFYSLFDDDKTVSFSGVKVNKPLLCPGKYGLKVCIKLDCCS